MKTLSAFFILIFSLTAFATKEWPEPDSTNCSSIAECHGKGDYAIQSGRIDFLGGGRGGDENFEIRAPSVVLMGHSATYWDTNGGTRVSVRQLMSDLKGRNLPIVYLSPNYKIDRQKEFLTYGDFDFIGSSGGGDHNLRLPETNIVLLSGGYYHQCLCNSLADVIDNIKPGKTMTLVMPMETVYLSDQRSEVKELFPEVKKFSAPPSVRDLLNVSTSPNEFKKNLVRSVSQLLLGKSNVTVWRTGKGVESPSICPFQPAGNHAVDPATLTTEIYIHDSKSGDKKELIGSFGNGPRKLKLVFASLDTATKYLVDQAGPVKAQSVHFDWGGGDGPSSKEADKVTRVERTVYSRRFAKPSNANASTIILNDGTSFGSK
jgi:hypothetical protein